MSKVNCHEAQYWSPNAPVVHKDDYDTLAAENQRLQASLSDPVSVLVNLKRGVIAKPSIRSIVELYCGEVLNDEDALQAELLKLRAELAALKGEQVAVHWRAALDPTEVPMQPNHHEHIAGFTNQKAAEEWVSARLNIDGWHYTLEALYTHPAQQQPGQDVEGLVEALKAIAEGRSNESAPHIARTALAAHDKQSGGEA